MKPSITAESRTSTAGKRRALLGVIILLGAIGIGWLVYDNYFRPLDPEEFKQQVLQETEKNSPPVTEEFKNMILDALIAQQEESSVVPEAERQVILDQMGAQ